MARVPFKKKTPYNLNEVDVNLLLKNPSHIRKVVKGNNKEEHYHEEGEDEEEDDEEEDENEDHKLDKHMKRYISDYFANKYNKESGQRKKVKQRLDFIKELFPKPLKDFSEWEAEQHRRVRDSKNLKDKN